MTVTCPHGDLITYTDCNNLSIACISKQYKVKLSVTKFHLRSYCAEVKLIKHI